MLDTFRVRLGGLLDDSAAIHLLFAVALLGANQNTDRGFALSIGRFNQPRCQSDGFSHPPTFATPTFGSVRSPPERPRVVLVTRRASERQGL